jgi:hypothetical protein
VLILALEKLVFNLLVNDNAKLSTDVLSAFCANSVLSAFCANSVLSAFFANSVLSAFKFKEFVKSSLFVFIFVLFCSTCSATVLFSQFQDILYFFLSYNSSYK